MNQDEKIRSAASDALIALRTAMGKTQAAFAVEVMKTAVTTIARWEKNVPPRGENLIQLSKIADREGLNELGNTFRSLYLHDAVAQTEFDTLARIPMASPDIGFLLVKLKNREEYDAADSFQSILSWLRHSTNPKYREMAAAALKALNEAAEKFPEEGGWGNEK